MLWATNLNHTESNNEVYFAFQQTGDLVYPNFMEDVENLLNNSVRVALFYGDAGCICNWYVALNREPSLVEAVSLAVDYNHKKQFAPARYAPFMVSGTEYGEVRQFRNFSFLRTYEAGHEAPYYQPEASLEVFRRVLLSLGFASGKLSFGANYLTHGLANATHTETFVPLPSSTMSANMSSTSAIITTAVPVYPY